MVVGVRADKQKHDDEHALKVEQSRLDKKRAVVRRSNDERTNHDETVAHAKIVENRNAIQN